MRDTRTEEQRVEAIKAMYKVVGKSFTEAYTEMGKTIAAIAEVLKEAEQ